MRIVLAVGTLNLGGAETQLVGTAIELSRMGHDVEVLLLGNEDGVLRPRLAEAGVSVRAIGFGGIQFRNDRGQLRPWRLLVEAGRLLALVRHLRRQRVDVLHAYLFWSYAIFIPLAWVARVPVRIAARRGLHEALPDYPLLMALTRLSTVMSTAVVANSRAVAEDARVNEHVPVGKLHVIPNAVDLPDQVAHAEQQPAAGLLVANLIHYKGHLDLVEALAGLDDPPVIRCIGEGPMREQIQAAVRGRGVEQVMRLEGRRVGAKEEYAHVQFAVLCSHSEGMPNAVLEAMAAGLPVVATDVGGCAELVEDGVTGRLVPARDPRALGAAIAEVARDSDFRRRAGKVARMRAEGHSWSSCAAAHVALYSVLHPRLSLTRE